MKYKFKLGDRVRWHDELGTIIIIDTDSVPYGVWFDRDFPGGHGLNSYSSRAKVYVKAPSAEERYGKNRGYWLKEDNLTYADSHRLDVVSNGKTVTAIYYKDDNIVAKGVARCHPEDEFDFFAGAEIAMQRAADRITLINGQYVYIGESTDDFTRGKTYVFTDGFATNDKKSKYPQNTCATLAEANDKTSFFCQNFVKLV